MRSLKITIKYKKHLIGLLLFVGATVSLWYGVSVGATYITRSSSTDGLIAHWTFDDISGTSVPDQTDGDHTGTLVNGPTTTTGLFNSGVFFDGDDQYADFGAFTETDAFSVSLWGKRYSGAQTIVSYDAIFGYNTNYAGFAIKVTTDDFAVFNTGGSQIAVWQNADDLRWEPDDQWHHIVFTQDGSGAGSNVNVYVDGEEAGVKTATTDPLDTFRLGQLATLVSGRAFGGILDEVRVYDRVLTQVEVLNLMGDRPATINKTIETALDNGLVGHWTFDGQNVDWGTKFSVLDRSGQGNHASTTLATTTAPTEGVLGQAFDFPDETHKYVNVPTSASLELTTKITVSAWIKPTADDIGTRFDIFNKMSSNQAEGVGSAGRGGYYLGNDTNGGSGSPNRWCFTLSNNGGTSNVCSTLTLEAGEWYHFVGTYDADAGTPRRLYTNGVQTASNGSVFTPQVISNISAYIGGGGFNNGAGWTGDNYFGGVIDEIRVYNRALSANEVRALYEIGNTFHVNVSPQDSLTSGLVGYWTFDGNDTDWSTGTTIDRGSSSSDGSLVSMSTTTSPEPAIHGQGFVFKNGSDRVDTADSTELEPSDLTVSTWVRIDEDGPNLFFGTQLFVTKAPTAGGDFLDYALGYYSTGANARKYLFSIGGASTVTSDASYFPGDGWTHVVGTRDSTASRIYVNGVQKGTGSATAFSYAGGEIDGIRFGQHLANGQGHLIGALDETRIYNRALSANEVKALYELGR